MATFAPPAEVIVPWTQPFATVGAWTRTQSAAALSGGYLIGPVTIDNSISFRVALGVGTYTLTDIAYTNSSHGISTYTLDGVSIGTLDWYSAGAVANVVKTITGITVTTAGVYTFTLTQATKNASSSNYIRQIQLLALHRTDDASGPISGAPMPHRVDIIPWAGTAWASAGTAFIEQLSGLLSGGRASPGSALNSFYEWLVPLAAGTWTITFIHTTTTSEGISTITLNGTSVGTFDKYSSGTVNNVVTTVTGVVVPVDGIYKFRQQALTKNASATAYNQRTNHIVLQRNGDVVDQAALLAGATARWDTVDYDGSAITWAEV